MNVASVLGDISHVVAIFLLFGWILHKRSCEGISGKMHILWAIVFTARYLDLFVETVNAYLIFMKIFLIIISYISVLLIFYCYKKTYEREFDAFWIETLLVVCLGLGLLECYDISEPEEVLWAFSRYLEAVVFIPQLYFTYKKEMKSNIITYYVLALILYRGLYIVNWVIRYKQNKFFDGFLVFPGLLQFAIYFIYFFLPNGDPANLLPTTLPNPSQPATTPEGTATPTPIRNAALLRQESLLETPFLKRNAASYSSVYVLAMDSKNTSPNGSVNSLNIKQEERY